MPTQKRPLTDTNADGGCEELSLRNDDLEQEDEPMGEAEEVDEEEEDGVTAGESCGAEDSQGSLSSEAADEIPEDYQENAHCDGCLHRLCRNNECPACRTHCASQRSLRDDTNYDSLIATLHPNIDKYEEEAEAQAKRRSGGKDAVSLFSTRSQRNLRCAYTRRRQNRRGAEHIGSEDYEDENDSNGGKCSSSADEQIIKVRPQHRRRRTAAWSTVPLTSADCEGPANETAATSDTRGISPGLVWNPEMLACGRGGTSSHTRHGSSNGSNKNVKNSCTATLVEYLKNLEENDDAHKAGRICKIQLLSLGSQVIWSFSFKKCVMFEFPHTMCSMKFLKGIGC